MDAYPVEPQRYVGTIYLDGVKVRSRSGRRHAVANAKIIGEPEEVP